MMESEKIGLTVCFYQYPFALEEIQAWEAKMWSVIFYKRKLGNNIFYLIEVPKSKEDRPKLELMIATPISGIHFIDIGDIQDWSIQELKRIFQTDCIQELIFGKTIIFGAAHSRALKKIARITEDLELGIQVSTYGGAKVVRPSIE